MKFKPHRMTDEEIDTEVKVKAEEFIDTYIETILLVVTQQKEAVIRDNFPKFIRHAKYALGQHPRWKDIPIANKEEIAEGINRIFDDLIKKSGGYDPDDQEQKQEGTKSL